MYLINFIKDYLRARKSGFIKQDEDPRDYQFVASAANYPQKVDLRDKFQPIRHQLTSQACTGFAVASVVEYFLNKDYNLNREVSPLYIWYFGKKLHGWETENKGVWLRYTLKALFNDGFAYEYNLPFDRHYLDDKLIYHFNKIIKDVSTFFLDKFQYEIMPSTKIIDALSMGIPVWLGLNLNSSFFGNRSGIITNGKPLNLFHAMVVVGYDLEKRVYILRNSWGTSWGDYGYCYVPFEYLEENAHDITCINYKGE